MGRSSTYSESCKREAVAKAEASPGWPYASKASAPHASGLND